MTDDTELDELRRSLLRGGRPRLTAEQGDEAFDQHGPLPTIKSWAW